MFAAYAAWSAREIELQALALLVALDQISTPSAAHLLNSLQILVQNFVADRNRQKGHTTESAASHSPWAGSIGGGDSEGRRYCAHLRCDCNGCWCAARRGRAADIHL